ncbi:hypothetical protein SAMN02746041_02834 [Desulfacinum hydrothermale DSM 13146]|uniref:Uncharacterized protein n=1 Tax=Desulfacinum hydrothermale DSM 13146 TaxID=1121390 RepID=A0A1W1XT12_9BACT|nr:hypothetical protein SAMN02746041_02834 [Desulfacinum hydrothermale DSM 13146]
MGKIRLTAVTLGIFLAAFFCAVTPYNNVQLQNSPLAGGHFPVVAFAALFVLAGLYNPLARKLHPRAALSAQELFLLWAMISVSTGIAYTGLFRTFLVNITTPAWLYPSGSPQAKTLLPLASPKLFPLDPQAVQTLYQGLENGRQLAWWQVPAHIPWSAWTLPLLSWALFILLVYMALFGMVGLFSHQWIENEKMNFPLLRVPQVLSTESEKGGFWNFVRHKYFLVGLAVPVCLHLLNGLHTFYPHVPQIPTLFLAQPYVPKEGLLSGFHKAKIYLYPAFIGFAYLTSKQISFSLWFFFVLGGLLPGLLQLFGWRLPSAALGTTFGPVLDRVEEMQMVGAFGVFFFFIVWLSRNHLKEIVWKALGRSALPDEIHRGLVSPRTALYLFLVGFAGTLVWMRFFGMDWLPAVLFLAVCFMLQLVSARLICQGGLPYFTLTAAPSDGFLAALHTKTLAPLTLYLALVIQKVTFVDMRESLMPSLFHASKLSEDAKPRSRFLAGVVAAMVIGIVVSCLAMLILAYKTGLNLLPDDWAVETARRVHENAFQLINYPEAPKRWSILFAVGGAVVMSLLVFGFRRFIWWPLHPIGYLTTYSSAMRILWFSFLIGWFCNTLVLRYGGVRQFKELRRLFIGLIVGDMLMAVAWMVAGLFTPFSYHVLPL